MKTLRKLVYALQRRFDLFIHWQAFKDMAHSLDEAQVMFLVHARGDKAWTDLCPTEEALVAYAQTLR